MGTATWGPQMDPLFISDANILVPPSYFLNQKALNRDHTPSSTRYFSLYSISLDKNAKEYVASPQNWYHIKCHMIQTRHVYHEQSYKQSFTINLT